MALQNASVHKSFADIQLDYDGSIMNAIESALMAATRLDPPKYEIFKTYPINGNREVTQPDDSTIDCDKMVMMIRAYGYTVGFVIKLGVVKLHIRIE